MLVNGKIKHRLPITNARVTDVVYQVQTLNSGDSITWSTSKYGDITIGINNALVFGSYRIVVDDIDVTNEETDIYWHNTPGTVIVTDGRVDCVLNSTIWGTGRALGNGQIVLTNDDPIFPFYATVRSKNVMTFAASLSEQDGQQQQNSNSKKCKNLKLK